MTLYYRSNEVLITGTAFVSRREPTRMYRITDLTDVGMACRTTAPSLAGAPLALGTGAVAAASWPVIGSTVALGAGVTLAVGLGIASVATRQRRGPSWELHARVGGIDTVLYTSTDGQTFRQVTRALVRALESHAPTSTGYELARH